MLSRSRQRPFAALFVFNAFARRPDTGFEGRGRPKLSLPAHPSRLYCGDGWGHILTIVAADGMLNEQPGTMLAALVIFAGGAGEHALSILRLLAKSISLESKNTWP